MIVGCLFLFQAEDGIRDLVRSRGLGDVYKRQAVLSQLGKDKVLSTNVGDDNSEGLFTGGKAPFFILSLIHI